MASSAGKLLPRAQQWLSTLLGICLLGAACERDQSPIPVAPPIGDTADRIFDLERLRFPDDRWRGLSGLTVDAAGVLWSVPERQRQLVPWRLEGKTPSLARPPVTLEGAGGLDTESIASLGPDRFALGTEAHHARPVDEVLIVTRKGNEARVAERLRFDYEPFHLQARSNRGIEGLCFAAPHLVMVNENVVERGDARFAPVARYDLILKEWSRYNVRLTTAKGKLAGVACRASQKAGGLDLVAIERDYGVARLVTLSLDAAAHAEPVDLAARLLFDLKPLLKPLINCEGIVWKEDGSIVILADNDSGGVIGPSEALLLTPR